MQLILLSGGSGKRLWPLSTHTRPKQFLQLLDSPDGGKESMLQRVVRQFQHSKLNAQLNLATSADQEAEIISQLGPEVSVITEPQRRDTFPAIALASAYLALEKQCPEDELVVVMPCDPYTEQGYFDTIAKMCEAAGQNAAELILMGIAPTYPSQKYGYIVPQPAPEGRSCELTDSECRIVAQFTEKPNAARAEELISQGALWNGGVFAFRLSYMMRIVERYVRAGSFEELRARYAELPKISFDYEVVEKAQSVGVVTFEGKWKDLGTWNALTEELSDATIGNAAIADSDNTHIINELDLPIMCIGTQDLIVVASPDGILITHKDKSESIKLYADQLNIKTK